MGANVEKVNKGRGAQHPFRRNMETINSKTIADVRISRFNYEGAYRLTPKSKSSSVILEPKFSSSYIIVSQIVLLQN